MSADALPPAGAVEMPVETVELRIDDLPPARAFKYPRLPGMSPAWADQTRRSPMPGDLKPEVEIEADLGEKQGDERSTDGVVVDSPWSWCRVLGQIGGLYVVLETEDGLVLMDPHAAHERVLFDRLMADAVGGSIQSQNLLIPETVEMQPADAMLMRKNLEILSSMGFGISEFGGDCFVIDAVPASLSAASAGALLREIATTLERAGTRGGKRQWREEAVAQAACKAAVKARDRLSLAEIERLVVDLAQAELPYTCPHGRPTMILTSYQELGKKFGRE